MPLPFVATHRDFRDEDGGERAQDGEADDERREREPYGAGRGGETELDAREREERVAKQDGAGIGDERLAQEPRQWLWRAGWRVGVMRAG